MLVNKNENCALEQYSDMFSGKSCARVDSILYEYEKKSNKYVDVQKLHSWRGAQVKHYQIQDGDIDSHYLAFIGNDINFVEDK